VKKYEVVWIFVLPRGLIPHALFKVYQFCYQPKYTEQHPKMPCYCHWQSKVLTTTYIQRGEGGKEFANDFFSSLMSSSSSSFDLCICILQQEQQVCAVSSLIVNPKGPERHIQADGTSPKNYTSGLALFSFHCHILIRQVVAKHGFDDLVVVLV